MKWWKRFVAGWKQSPPEWHAYTERKFKDSQGRWYRRYIDEMQIPILRMEQIHVVTREISNRVSDADLNVHLANVEAIATGEQTAAEKVKLLYQHAINLRERVNTDIAEPLLLMKLVCAMYIREDQDPAVWDEVLEAEKLELLMAEQKTGLAGFFYQAGLSAFLPSPGNLQHGTKELLKKSEKLARHHRKMEAQIAATTA